ncbi:hypothetical protein HN018_27130 (plasmid) [Lichenicola cladoniae]|uniref:Dynamin N-terminal domain-containing protein n=1 Tax=Lichenicola cladoniae TaxID=1484109 RepID=A0A6M8I153_9PROT|nr:dynamin family protein [Lichenicola cladoniae]NPD67661.1 hypothetical protein [Acetobacteraceae bacterium]QKE93821.1 hypothetical protein HN018_27130 [Lichenicola cladoniae]
MPTLDLHRYELLKSELADLLRAVPWRADQFERNRDLFARLAEDRFNLAVVGRFSRGKSTLMNAMLGLDRLPTGIEPLTSVITSITYGSHEKVVLHFLDTTLFLDIRLDQLEDYVTERGNPSNRRRIREAEIQLPADLLRSGFRFIDTPGLGSAVAGNTVTTRAFLPEADAFLLVTGFNGSLTEDEADILYTASKAGRQVFIVLNKADMVDGTARDAAVADLRARLQTLGLPEAQKFYPVSAATALSVRLGRMPASRLEESGLLELEHDVLAYMTNGKRHAFLHGMYARLDAVLAAAPGLGAVRERLVALRHEIDQAALPPSDPVGSSSLVNAPIAANLLDCQICSRIERAVFDALTQLQGSLRRDLEARQDLARQGGLCGPHSRQFIAHAAPREVCIGFAPVLDAQAALLEEMADAKEDASSTPAALWHSASGCPFCRLACGVADASLDKFEAILQAGSIAPHPEPTVCLPHLQVLAMRLHGDSVLPDLLRRQAGILKRRADDMRRFALKQDASLRDQITDEEKRSAQSGIAALVGISGKP